MTASIQTNSGASFEQAMFLADQQSALPKTSISSENMDRIDATSKKFEEVFVSEMLSHMYEGVKSDGMFGGGYGEEMFRSMNLHEYSKQIVSRGGIGIADSIKKEMIKMQEQQTVN